MSRSSGDERLVIVTDGEDEFDMPYAPNAGAFAGPHSSVFASPHANAFASPHANAFAGPHASAFASPHANAFASPHANAFAGPHANAFAGPHAGAFAEPHAGAFAGPHAGAFAGPHAGAFAGPHAGAFAGPHGGAFAGLHAGAFADPHANAFARPHAGAFARPHAGAFAGPHASAFAGPHAGAFADPHANAFADPHANAFAGPHAGAFAGPHAGAFAGPHAGAFAGPHASPDACVGQVDNVVRPVRPLDDRNVRAGPSWTTDPDLFLEQNLALHARLWNHPRDLSTGGRGRRQTTHQPTRQPTRRPPRPSTRHGIQQSERHYPYGRQILRDRGTQTATNTTLTYPTQTTPPLAFPPITIAPLTITPMAIPPLAMPTLAVPPLYPIRQNPGPSEHVQYQTIRQLLNPNYTQSPRSQMTVISPPQLFASHASTQLPARSSPMVYFPPPQLVPITPARHTQYPTTHTAAPSFNLPFIPERPLDLRVPQRHEQPFYPILNPISQAFHGVRYAEPHLLVHSTPHTHTITSTTPSVVYLPSTLLTQSNTEEPSLMLDTQTAQCIENMMNQPARQQPQTPTHSLSEHQQCQQWPLDIFVATDVVDEMDTSEYDHLLGIAVTDSPAVSASVSFTPVTQPLPTINIVPPTPANSPTTTTTTTSTGTTKTTTSSSEEPQSGTYGSRINYHDPQH